MAPVNTHLPDTQPVPFMPDQFDPTEKYTVFRHSDLDLLRGSVIYLEPLTEQYRDILHGLAKDERLWEFTKTLLINDTYDEQFRQYFNDALNLPSVSGQAFVIRTVKDNGVIGMTRVFHIEPKDKRGEIGFTWYIPSVWGKVHNKECKLLLLQYLFEVR